MKDRLVALRKKLIDIGIDALIVNQPENRRYLSGFTGSAGELIISQEAAILATDFRYYAQVIEETPDFELFQVGYEKEFVKHLSELLARIRVQRVGFESEHVTVADIERWRKNAPDVKWMPTSGLVEGLRAVKSESEINIIRRAVAVTDQAFKHAIQNLHPNMTERDLAGR